MLQPDVLLLDEPFSAVDPITRLGLYESFEQVKADDPATVVFGDPRSSRSQTAG